MVSKQILFAKRFDSSSNNWANSELRNYLNGEFFEQAFTPKEKQCIVNSILTDVNNTKDDVFLLSTDEISLLENDQQSINA